MKTSICITVFNEEENVKDLLDSLLLQTKKPDEVVIVDGGSKDNTAEIINSYQKIFLNKKIVFIFKIAKGASIAKGRNLSIEKAKFPIIASIDAGCVAKKDWLNKITRPFVNKNIGLVAGFYDMSSTNSLQKAMNVFLGVMPSQFDPKSFMPSARSVAFRKNVWKKVDGFNEKLESTGEDTQFFYKLIKLGVKIKREKSARVEWRDPENYNLKIFSKKMFNYAKGDATVRIWWHPAQRLASHNIKIVSIYFRYFLGMALTIGFLHSPLILPIILTELLIYSLWSFNKVYTLTGNIAAGLWGIIVQYTSDVFVMLGFISGFSSKYKKG